MPYLCQAAPFSPSVRKFRTKPLEGKDASMRINRPDFAGWRTLNRRRVVRLPSQAPELHVAQFDHSLVRRPLDWGQAVRAAAARLNESRVLPDTNDQSVVEGMAERLAPLLVAYGKLAEEVDRMQAGADESPVNRRAGERSTTRH